MKLSFVKMLQILLEGRNVRIFFFLTIISMAFSISVILSTIGLMDGYELILKEGLRNNSSDLEVTNDFGFFEINEDFRALISKNSIKNFSGVIKTEGFIINGGVSKGVLINGIDVKEFASISPLKVRLDPESIAIGSEIAKDLKLKRGDGLTLAFTRGNQNFESLPYVKRFTVSDIIKHGVYRKDSRIVYLPRSYLERFTNAKGKVNTCLIKVADLDNDEIAKLAIKLNQEFSNEGYSVKPYWSDFSRLLEAVEVEKFSITVIMQLIVIIALFNIVAFINFSALKKSQEFFLLRALGLSFKGLYRFWASFIILIWASSCLLSLFFTMIFDKVILRLPFLKIPGSIYELEFLKLSLDMKSIIFVFGLTFLWSLGIIYIITRIERGKSLVQGLRQEYN